MDNVVCFHPIDIFKVNEKVIKQMKRLQNPGWWNGDDRNDMEDIEHRSEDENHV
jgi:hypothetical protein